MLRKSISKTFTANIDLWSIGVTLYHVATGNLPFRPYGGRKNKETMHLITTKKASGVISGTQTSENGQIEWSRTLPAHCQLSTGLKQLVTPLLAGLLEVSGAAMLFISLKCLSNSFTRNISNRKINSECGRSIAFSKK